MNLYQKLTVRLVFYLLAYGVSQTGKADLNGSLKKYMRLEEITGGVKAAAWMLPDKYKNPYYTGARK